MKGYIRIPEGCVESASASVALVSVIVPVYNAQRYLDQALDSLENQSLRSMEILCVNDGSTDNSRAILEVHAHRDERIRIIDKANGGYGSACNRGLDEAKGTWIAIFEPDDWIEGDMYKDLTDFAAGFKEDIDIVKSPYWCIANPDTPQEIKVHCTYYGVVKPRKQPFRINDPAASCIMGHHPSIWSALYRRNFLKEHDIRFREYPGAGWADNPFLIETLVQARAIVYLNRAYYCYRGDDDEKLAAFAHENTLLPVQRWHDMADILERLHVDDETILREHTRRGFTYISGIVEEVDLSHDYVFDAVRSIFERMDDELVFSDELVSPGWKYKYAEIKGVEAPSIKGGYYKRNLVKKGLHNIRYDGIKYTWGTTKKFLSRRKRREGRA